MRKINIIILFLITVLSASAQEKRWENNFYLGQGLILDYKNGDGEGGMSFVAGYGLSYRFSPHWSVMPGLALRAVAEGAPAEHFDDGYDYDTFAFLDIPLLVRYHTGVNKRYFTFGFGYQFARHFSVGLDGYICLTNLKQHHGLTSGGIYIHSLTCRMAFNF